MRFKETLRHCLSEWKPQTGQTALSLHDEASGWKVRLNASHADVIGAKLRDITLQRAEPIDDVRAWAERVADKATGLRETLKLLEIDESRSTALLRSERPEESDDAVCYYEMRLTGDGGASLHRYRASRAQQREAIEHTLTHEVIAKLIEDVISA